MLLTFYTRRTSKRAGMALCALGSSVFFLPLPILSPSLLSFVYEKGLSKIGDES
jgi:hypothetical protein